MSATRLAPGETDVLIVGGGPAGLAAAIALRQRRLTCVVVEVGAGGQDKACGEGLMPDTLASLAALGVEVTEADGYAFRGIRFANAKHEAAAVFPHGAGVGMRRPDLHRRMAARAEEAGATLLWNSRVTRPEGGLDGTGKGAGQTALVNGQEVRFRWLVGADGQASSVRRWAGLDGTKSESVRYGFRTHYGVRPWSDSVEIHWAKSGQLYVTPVGPDCVCVVFLTRDHRCDRAAVLEEFPEVGRRLGGAAVVSPQRGAASVTRRLRRVARDSVALIGDASGSADSITGEGLGMSFRQAHALAEAIQSGSLDGYRAAHRRIARLPHAMGCLMLTLDRWPGFARRAMRELAGHPSLFQELLAVHVGEASLPAVLLRRAPGFGLGLLGREIPA